MSHIDDLVRMVWDKVRWYLDHEYRPVLVRAAGALSANTVPTAAIVAGAVTPDRLAAGGTTPSASTFYRGDGTWQPISGAGSSETFKVVFTNAGDVALRGDGTIATAHT